VTLHRTGKDGTTKTDAYWGLEKYSGGRDHSAKNFPTANAPLVIPASSFVVSFKSDGRHVAHVAQIVQIALELAPSLIAALISHPMQQQRLGLAFGRVPDP
jgi:hypothetical protein